MGQTELQLKPKPLMGGSWPSVEAVAGACGMEPRSEAVQSEHCWQEQLHGPAPRAGGVAAGGHEDESLQREVGKVHGTQSYLVRFGKRRHPVLSAVWPFCTKLD